MLPLATSPGGPPRQPGSRLYAQLPLTGACTRSANQWLIGVMTGTPCETDNRLDEALPGSLTYTSEPFDEPVYVNGPIQADLWIVPSGPDAVVSVAISDVAPDGTSRGLTNGLLVASRRALDPDRARVVDGQSIQPWHLYTQEAARQLEPGSPVQLAVEVFPTAAVIQPGHRLRVTVAPYDVPHALPPLAAAAGTLAGPVQVLSGGEHPSSVVLPVVAAAQAARPPAAGGAGAGVGRDLAPDGVLGSTSSPARLPATGGAVVLVPGALALSAALLARRLAAAQR